MPKDFAGRSPSSTRIPKKRKPTKRTPAKQRVLFHGPSFATGALVGAAIVILASYGPELWELPESTRPNAQQPPIATPRLEFDFPDLLKNSEVQPDPMPYAIPEKNKQSQARAYSIQAASFRNREDAEQLRARLLLDNLPAKTTASMVDGRTWYRVVVGPFQRRVDADRAMTRLRERGLSAIRINSHN